MTLDAEVYEQMFWSDGQSNAKPLVFSPQESLVLNYRPIKGMKAESNLLGPGIEPQACGVEAWYATPRHWAHIAQNKTYHIAIYHLPREKRNHIATSHVLSIYLIDDNEKRTICYENVMEKISKSIFGKAKKVSVRILWSSEISLTIE
ncbi:hypothetical protein TNCV_980021 [Trichonephila clavipes]|uniref:Uncharacterized protein n=1 Tax=Trichonephila clavipes TaxID=2585209 RepID=A0A8X6S506_TRICX|nr:hypothetical protein TNCV_980021 [Trichonephila clavipes]